MTVTVNLDKDKLITYLTIALKQRQRAANTFVQNYGNDSSAAREADLDAAGIRQVITDLKLANAAPQQKK